jgi:hypothetical protein
MSHFTQVKSEIADMEALRATIARMEFQLLENAQCRYYYGTEQKSLVIKLPGKYDAALEKQADGSYSIVADWYDGHVAKRIGQDGEILLQMYAVEKAKIEGHKRGFMVTETQGEDHILVTLRDPKGGALKIWCYLGGRSVCQPDGIRGASCMRFYDLEKALGAVEEHHKNGDFYLKDEDKKVQIKDSIDGRYFCG